MNVLQESFKYSDYQNVQMNFNFENDFLEALYDAENKSKKLLVLYKRMCLSKYPDDICLKVFSELLLSLSSKVSINSSENSPQKICTNNNLSVYLNLLNIAEKDNVYFLKTLKMLYTQLIKIDKTSMIHTFQKVLDSVFSHRKIYFSEFMEEDFPIYFIAPSNFLALHTRNIEEESLLFLKIQEKFESLIGKQKVKNNTHYNISKKDSKVISFNSIPFTPNFRVYPKQYLQRIVKMTKIYSNKEISFLLPITTLKYKFNNKIVDRDWDECVYDLEYTINLLVNNKYLYLDNIQNEIKQIKKVSKLTLFEKKFIESYTELFIFSNNNIYSYDRFSKNYKKDNYNTLYSIIYSSFPPVTNRIYDELIIHKDYQTKESYDYLIREYKTLGFESPLFKFFNVNPEKLIFELNKENFTFDTNNYQLQGQKMIELISNVILKNKVNIKELKHVYYSFPEEIFLSILNSNLYSMKELIEFLNIKKDSLKVSILNLDITFLNNIEQNTKVIKKLKSLGSIDFSEYLFFNSYIAPITSNFTKEIIKELDLCIITKPKQ